MKVAHFSVSLCRIGLYSMLLFTASCQQVSQSIKETLYGPQQDDQYAEAGFIADKAALVRAEQQLRELPRFQSKPIYIYADIHFYDNGHIMAKVQHPENPDYIDEYNYDNGEWSDPSPVQLSVSDEISERLVVLDSLPFSTVATVLRNYHDKAANVEGAELPGHIYAVVYGGEVAWWPTQIDGSRERWSIRFNMDGSVASFERQ